jgi:hypothetical protein
MSVSMKNEAFGIRSSASGWQRGEAEPVIGNRY